MKTSILWDYEFDRKRYVRWLLVTHTKSSKKVRDAFGKIPPQAVIQRTPSQWLVGPLQIGL